MVYVPSWFHLVRFKILAATRMKMLSSGMLRREIWQILTDFSGKITNCWSTEATFTTEYSTDLLVKPVETKLHGAVSDLITIRNGITVLPQMLANGDEWGRGFTGVLFETGALGEQNSRAPRSPYNCNFFSKLIISMLSDRS
jgi:hypothetical protein